MVDLKGEGPDAVVTAIEPQDYEHVGTPLDPSLTTNQQATRGRLTTVAIKGFRPAEKLREISDYGSGLSLRLRVYPTGHKSWVMLFRQNGISTVRRAGNHAKERQ